TQGEYGHARRIRMKTSETLAVRGEARTAESLSDNRRMAQSRASGAHPRILVIRRDNIGDLVCTTPLIFALRDRYPEAHIAALVNTYNEAVLAGNPALDAVHAYE